MKKFSKVGKRVMALFIIALLNINTYATQSSNDGSAFVTKAEFDTLMQNFNENMNIYQADLNAKIDDAIASYIGGLSGTTSLNISLPGYLWMKSYGNDVNLVELGIDTRKTEGVKDEKNMYRQGKLYTYYPKYYFAGTSTVCVGWSANAVYGQEIYVNHIISGATTVNTDNSFDNSTGTGRNYSTVVTNDQTISINPSIYLTESGKNYVNKVVKAPKVIDNEIMLSISTYLNGKWTYGGFLYSLNVVENTSYNLFAMNENGVVNKSQVIIGGLNFNYQDICTYATSESLPSGYTNIGNIIYNRTDVRGGLRSSPYSHNSRMVSYSRIVNYSNETNVIAPRFLKLPDSEASSTTNQVVAVTDKKSNDYGKIKNQLALVESKTVGATKVWYPVGNIVSSASYKPLDGGISYLIRAYRLNGVKYKPTDLYDYYVKNKYNTDVTLADRVIVYRNEELDKVKLQFQIVPTSNFLLTFSKNKEYQDGETNLYTFNYSGGSNPVQGSGKSYAIDSSIFSASNPLKIQIDDIDVNDFVWLGGQSINDGYVTFRFLEDATVLK